MSITRDTPTIDQEDLDSEDLQKVGQGDADSPGGSDDTAVGDRTHGQESYPGPRNGGESPQNLAPRSGDLQDAGDTPAAGDVDPDSTASADATGQGGDTQRKGIGHPYSS